MERRAKNRRNLQGASDQGFLSTATAASSQQTWPEVFFFSLSFLMTFINNESSNVKGYLEKGKTQKPSFPLQFLTCSGKYKGEKCYLLIHVLCNPVDCSPPRFLCPWDSPGKNTEMGCHFFLHGIFLSQGLNLGLWHCRPILYWLSR